MSALDDAFAEWLASGPAVSEPRVYTDEERAEFSRRDALNAAARKAEAERIARTKHLYAGPVITETGATALACKCSHTEPYTAGNGSMFNDGDAVDRILAHIKEDNRGG